MGVWAGREIHFPLVTLSYPLHLLNHILCHTYQPLNRSLPLDLRYPPNIWQTSVVAWVCLSNLKKSNSKMREEFYKKDRGYNQILKAGTSIKEQEFKQQSCTVCVTARESPCLMRTQWGFGVRQESGPEAGLWHRVRTRRRGQGTQSVLPCSAAYCHPDRDSLAKAVLVAVGRQWETCWVCWGNSKWVRTCYLIVSPIFLLSPHLDFKEETAETDQSEKDTGNKYRFQSLEINSENAGTRKEKWLVLSCRGVMILRN